jgi:nucleotide-binding universal stress UspA family protein
MLLVGAPQSFLTPGKELLTMNDTTLPPRHTDPLTSTAFVTEWTLEQTAGTAGTPPGAPVVAVVGFDGTQPAQRALDAAAELLRGRDGQLEVVYVAETPAGSAPPDDVKAQVSDRLDSPERRLPYQVRARLDPAEPRWHFQHRNGAVAHELMAAAEELRHQRGPDATIVLVVGGSSDHGADVAGTVPVNLARADQFPLVVVP